MDNIKPEKAGILIVDDDVLIAESNKILLKKSGYNPLGIAVDGLQAIEMAKEKSPQLILMDINLKSSIDGITAAEEIQKFADVPIIFITAYSDQNTIERAKKIGPFGYLIKPYDNRELLVAIETSLYKHSFDKKIKEQELLFRTVSNFAYAWEFWLLPDLQFKYCSPSSERISGYKPEELIAKPGLLFDIVHPDDRNVFEEHMRKFYPEGKNEIVNDFQFRIFNKQGDLRYISHTCTAIYDEKNIYLGRRVTNVDVTNRKLAEKALADSEAKYRLLFDASPVAIGMAELNGTILTANNVMKKMTGYDFEKEKNITIDDLYINKDVRLTLLTDLFKTGSVKDWEIELKRKDGSIFYALLNVDIIAIGESKYIFTNMRDITGQKQSEATLRENKERWESLFNNSPNAIAVYRAVEDGKDFVFADFNLAAQKTDNLTRDYVVGKRLSEIFFSVEELGFLDIFRKVWRTGKTEYISSSYYKDNRIEGWRENIIYKLNNGEIVAIYNDISDRMQAQIALHESEEKMRMIVEGTSFFFFYTQDINGDLTYISPTVERITGRKVNEWINQRHWFATDNSINLKAPNITQRHLRGEIITEPTYFELKHKNGSNIILEMFENPIFKDGKVIGLQGIAHDITESKIAEQAIRDSEERYRKLIDTIPNGVAVYQNGEFVFANTAGLDLMHANSRNELLGKPVLSIVHPDSQKDVIMRMHQVAQGNYVAPFEEKLIRLDGNIFDAEVSAINITYEGKPAGLVVVQDITERKMAEEKLQLLAQAVKNTEEGISITDLNNNLIFVNDAFIKIYGYSEKELISKNIGILRSQNNVEPVPDEVKAATITQGWTGELINKKKDGTDFPVLLSTSPVLKEDGEPFALLGIVRDITEQKKNQKALIESEERFRTVYNTSPSAISISEIETSKMMEVNDAYEKLFGFSRGEVIGRTSFEVGIWTNNEDRNRLKEALIKNNFYDNIETTFKTKNGSLRNCLASGRIIAINNIEYLLAMVNDITEMKKAGEALRESEQKFRSIFQNHSAIKLLIDPDTGLIEDANEAAAKYYGWSIDELKKMKIQQINTLPPEQAMGTLQRIKEYKQTHYEFRHRRKDGSIRDVEVFSSKIEIGGKIFLHSINHDITERKQAEEALRLSNLRYETLFTKAGDGIIILSTKCKIISVNESFANMHGYSINEMLKIKLQDLDTPETAKSIDEFIARILAGESMKFEVGHFHKDGHVISLEVTASCISIGDELFIQAFHRDISDKIAKEEEIRKLYKAIEQSQVAIIITNLEAKIEYVNPKFTEVTGYSFEEVLGQNPGLLKSGEKPAEEYRDMWTKLISGGTWTGVFLNKKKNGELFWESANISPIKNDKGNITHYVAVKEDITAKVKSEEELTKYRHHLEELVESRTEELDKLNEDLLEQLRREKELELMLRQSLGKEKELNELKTRFISTASHEFRTPLTSVLSSAELIQRYGKKWTEEKFNEHIERIKHSVDYVTKLLDEVLTISRVESGKIIFTPEKINLYNYCLTIIEEVKPSIRGNHNFSFNFYPEKRLYEFDQRLLKFILINLLSNAFKYSPKGGTVELSVKSIDKTVIFEVIDNGIGIPEEEKQYLFEPFRRCLNVGDIPGTGLGLSIVKEAVEIHHGIISVQSQLEKGSTFIVKLNMP